MKQNELDKAVVYDMENNFSLSESTLSKYTIEL